MSDQPSAYEQTRRAMLKNVIQLLCGRTNVVRRHRKSTFIKWVGGSSDPSFFTFHSLKTPAFTILEVTIAMLLAGISISMGYTAYRIIGRSFQQYDEKNRKMAESVLLDRLLKKDFLSANKISVSNDGLTFVYPQSEIYYSFRSDYILRDQAGLRKDTFFVQPSDLHTYIGNRESFSGELIDKMDFKTALGGSIVSHTYTRLYSAEELMRIANNQ